MELSNQKRRKQVIILSNVHPANQRESLKNFHHASLSELEDLFVLLLANKTLNSYGAQLYLDCLLPNRLCSCIGKTCFLGDTQVFPEIINSTFSSSKTAFEISLGLTGVLSLWLGIMKIGEKGGVIALFSKLLSPLFCKLFPEIPKGHPVTGSIL